MLCSFVSPFKRLINIVALVVLPVFIFEPHIYSMRRKESVLPLGHWLLAVAGSLMIIAYGLIRHDWVLVIGQFAVVFSIRNIMIYFSYRRKQRKGE